MISEAEIGRGLQRVRDKIQASCLRRQPCFQGKEPLLVAASKTKSKEYIIAAYNHGQKHFGENYVQELTEKSTDPEVRSKCPEIRWHFIGHLQSNKVNKVAQVPNIYLVETVDSEKVALALNQAYLKATNGDNNKRLRVMVQVNTSGEEAKSGCAPEAAASLVQFVREKCPVLNFVGLLTIGQYGYDVSQGLNPDYLRLVRCRKEIASALELDEDTLELSMGMSCDYEQAIEIGSTHVRVGTSIFGVRETKTEYVEDEDT